MTAGMVLLLLSNKKRGSTDSRSAPFIIMVILMLVLLWVSSDALAVVIDINMKPSAIPRIVPYSHVKYPFLFLRAQFFPGLPLRHQDDL